MSGVFKNRIYTAGSHTGGVFTPSAAYTAFSDFTRIPDGSVTRITVVGASGWEYMRASKAAGALTRVETHSSSEADNGSVGFANGEAVQMLIAQGAEHDIFEDIDGSVTNHDAIARQLYADDITGLKAKPVPSDGNSLCFVNNGTGTDGNAAIYEWVYDNTDSGDDFATVVSNNSATGRWKRKADFGLLDEDDFTSDSATQAPSQQSTKAYVASQIAGTTRSIADADVGGTADAITLTLTNGPALTDGLTLSFLPGAANTGAVTIAYNGGTAVALIDTKGEALAADDLTTTAPVFVRYDTTGPTWRLSGGGASADADHKDFTVTSGGTTFDIDVPRAATKDVLVFYDRLPVDVADYTIAENTPTAGKSRITINGFTLVDGVSVKIVAI